MTSAEDTAPTSASTPPTVRPLTGVEDLFVFYGLTRTYKRYVRDTPSTYEHLIAHIPGPLLYHPTAPHPPTSQPTPPSHVSDKATLLLPLSYPPTLPPPLHVRPVTQQQADAVLTFSVAGELGVVREEMRGKAERQRWMDEERSRRRLDKRSKKGEKKRKQADGASDGEDGKRLKLDGGGAMIDIS